MLLIPTDETHLPKWFKERPSDDGAMESTVIDSKIVNLLEVLEWDPTLDSISTKFNDLFTFE